MRLGILLACAVLAAGCGSDEKSGSGGTIEAPLEDRQAIETVFESYNAALVERDFDTACDALSPSTIGKLQENVSRLGQDVDTCQEALEAAYESAGKTTALLDEIARNAKIADLSVSGDNATIKWTTKARGKDVDQTQQAEKRGEEWKLVDTRTLGK